MTAEIINLNDATAFPRKIPELAGFVWTKPRWIDPWTPRPDMIVTSCRWVAFPDVDTATLVYRYGRVLLPGQSRSMVLTPISARGYWVLIRFPTHDGSAMTWLGFAEPAKTREHSPATANLPMTGVQEVPCFGMGRVLQQAVVTTTVHVNPTDPTKIRRTQNTCPNFNDKLPLRSENKMSFGNGSTVSAHVFDDVRSTKREYWTAQDIVEHLLTFHMPTPSLLLPNPNSNPSDAIPWRLQTLAGMGGWELPKIEADGRPVMDILRQLIGPEKLSTLIVSPASTHAAGENVWPHTPGIDPPIVTAVDIGVVSLAADPIVLPTGDTFLPAAAQLDVRAINDPLTVLSHDIDSTRVVDQVIVRGPREISVCTLTYPGQLSRAWTDSEEDEYEIGASGEVDYNAMTPSQKQTADATKRGAEKLADVFALFQINKAWNFKIGDEPVFLDSNPDPNPGGTPPPPHVPYLGHIEIMSDVPIYLGNGTRYGTPLVTFNRPGDNKRVSGYQLARMDTGQLAAKKPYTVTFEADNSLVPSLRLNVGGAPQHAIAGPNFQGNDFDVEQSVYGDIDYQSVQVTLAILGNRRAAWSVPQDADIEGFDISRRRIYTFDDWETLRLINVVKDTVTGIAPNGDPEKSPGKVENNPLPTLQAIAMLITRFAHSPNHVIRISTPRKLIKFAVGMLIRNIDTSSISRVDSPIVEIRIEHPEGGDGAREPAMVHITAASQPFELFQYIGQPS